MNSFSDFNIAPPPQVKVFVGEKIHINNVLNVSIKVLDFKVEPSKVKEGDCLHLQIEKGGDKRVVFISSKNLIHQIKQVPKDKFPFTTTIRMNGCCEFT